MTNMRKVREVLAVCDTCVYCLESEFSDGCTRLHAPNIISLEFIVDCLTNSKHIELNRHHISKMCPKYETILKIVEG